MSQLQYDKKAFADWQERHGKTFKQAVNAGKAILEQFLTGDYESMNIDVIFMPTSASSSKLTVEYRRPYKDEEGRIVGAAIFCKEVP